MRPRGEAVRKRERMREVGVESFVLGAEWDAVTSSVYRSQGLVLAPPARFHRPSHASSVRVIRPTFIVCRTNTRSSPSPVRNTISKVHFVFRGLASPRSPLQALSPLRSFVPWRSARSRA